MGTANEKEKAVRRSVIQSMPGFWGYSALSAVMFLLIQLVGLIPAVLMQRTVDILIPNREIKTLNLYILLFCLIPLAATALTAAYRYGLAIVCRKLGLKMAIRGFENLTAQSVSYFDGENSSELAAHCRKESMQYITFWMMDIPQLIATGICGIVIFGYLLTLHWGVALLLLLYFPVAYFPSNAFANKVQKLMNEIVANNAVMNRIINDTFRGIKAVKAMVLEKVQAEKLKQVNEKSVAIWSKVALFDNLSGIWVNDFSDAVFKGVSFGLSAFLIVLGKLTLGSLVIILNYSGRFIEIAKQFMNTNYHFKEQLGEYDKLFEILTLESPKAERAGNREFSFRKEIRFSDVSFAYDPKRGDILKHLDLTIRPNEWLGIVGASGAGKTTIFDLLLRFYEPQSGTITADGERIDSISASSLRSQIAKVSQDTFLFPGTIRQNLLLANPNASDQEMDTALRRVGLTAFLSRLPEGLNTDIGENGLLLSGGERQKLGLAQGLLRNCKVILLDEVTANIDRDGEEEIKNVLLKLKQERELTVISISHRIDFLKDADRIVVLEDGKVKEETDYQTYSGKKE